MPGFVRWFVRVTYEDVPMDSLSKTLGLSGFDQNSQFKAIVEGSDDAIISKDLAGTILSWNLAAERIFGYTAEEMIGAKMILLFPEGKELEESAILSQIAKGGKVDHFHTQRVHKDGSLLNVSVTASPIRSWDGLVVGVSSIARDITAQVRTEQEIARYQALIESSEDAIISKDLQGNVQTWNPAAEQMFGYSSAEMIGQPITRLFPPDRLKEEQRILEAIRRGEHIRHFRTTRLKKDGAPIYVSVSISPVYDSRRRVCGVCKIARDITKEIIHEEMIWKQANFDATTQLFNREGFSRYVDDLVRMSSLCEKRFALLLLDIDNFKIYNDTYGHDFGDKLLFHVATTLKGCLRESDELARFGGDEFIVCLSGFSSTSGIQDTAQKIIDQVGAVVEIDGTMIAMTCSIGIAVFPDDGGDLKSLLQKADHAMYGAKKKGKSQFRFFSGIAESDRPEDYSLVQALSLAIENRELELHYQPILDAHTLRVVKAEALIRWRHPELGFVPPDRFIPLAEKYGLIKQLGNWVTDQALSSLAEWVALFGQNFQLSINKSPYEFYDHDESIGSMTRALHHHGLSGRNLVIEITEHSLMDHSQVTRRILDSYQGLGIEIAIDDFGTGYSSLSYLKHYPVKLLKIDKSFVASLRDFGADYHLCDGILRIARNLGLQVVAEGIENEEQQMLLSSLGCDFYQGYLFSRPLNRSDFEAFMQRFVSEPDGDS